MILALWHEAFVVFVVVFLQKRTVDSLFAAAGAGDVLFAE